MGELAQEYFNWIKGLVEEETPIGRTYDYLLDKLHQTDFDYILPMDANRYDDGVDLRYRFGYDVDIDYREIATYVDGKPCSVLEMMVALAIKAEEGIMYDPKFGDRTGKWFWGMVNSLGLTDMDDDHYDELFVDNTLRRFINRQYKRNGEGGLFTIDNTKKDMRREEIWYQMMWYLDSLLGY